MRGVTKGQAKGLIGKHIYVKHKNGSVFSGKLLEVKGDELVFHEENRNKVKTKGIIPLVLFDLLAIGTLPYAYGGYPYGGGYGYGYGGSYGGYYGGYGFY